MSEPSSPAGAAGSRRSLGSLAGLVATAVVSKWPVILGVWVVAAALVSRAIVPGVRGAVVGISGAIDAADSALAIVAQLTAMFLSATSLIFTIRIVRSRAPIYLRIGVIMLDGLIFFGTAGSMVTTRAPGAVTAAACFACAVTAIALGLYAFRRAEIGLVSLVPVVCGVASIVRAVGALMSDRAADIGADLESIVGAFRLATILSTVSFVLAAGSIGLACAWMIRRSRRAGGVVVGVIAVLSIIGAKLATSAPDDLEPIFVVVVRRAVQHLLTRPAPLVPEALVMALVIAAPLTSLAALTRRGVPPRLAAGVGLAVLVLDTADIHILGLALACGALSLAAYAVDPHGVSAAVAQADERRAAGEAPEATDGTASADPEASLPRRAS